MVKGVRERLDIGGGGLDGDMGMVNVVRFEGGEEVMVGFSGVREFFGGMRRMRREEMEMEFVFRGVDRDIMKLMLDSERKVGNRD